MTGIYDELRLIIHVAWRKRWPALLIAWAVAIIGWLIISLIPNGYASESQISVEMQSLLPGKIGVVPAERAQEIERVKQTLISSVSLEKVVRGTRLASEVRTPADMALMVEELRDDLSVKSVQNLFKITARSARRGLSERENARLAQEINQKLLDIFVADNLAGNRDETDQTLRFFDEQLARREKELQTAEQAKADFEQRYAGLLPVAGVGGQRLDQARAELANVDQNLISAQSALVAAQSQIALTPSGSVMGGDGRLGQLEAEIVEAQSKGWTESHPDMKALRKQLAAARAAFKSAGGGAVVGNPAYASLRAIYAERQATVAGLRVRRAALMAEVNSLSSRSAAAPNITAQQAQMNRDYDVMKDQYDKLLKDREEIRLRSDVESQTDSVKFRVIDPPTYPRTPDAPNRPLLLFAVLVIALGAGVAAAVVAGQIHRTYSNIPVLQKSSGMNVLGAISHVATLSDTARQRRHAKLFKGMLLGLFACFIVLMAVEFIQRGTVA